MLREVTEYFATVSRWPWYIKFFDFALTVGIWELGQYTARHLEVTVK